MNSERARPESNRYSEVHVEPFSWNALYLLLNEPNTPVLRELYLLKAPQCCFIVSLMSSRATSNECTESRVHDPPGKQEKLFPHDGIRWCIHPRVKAGRHRLTRIRWTLTFVVDTKEPLSIPQPQRPCTTV